MDDGRYVGRGVAGGLGHTSAGNPQIAVDIEITQGENAGAHATWYGYFTDGTQERTFAALRCMGWKGDDLSDLSGIDANEISLTLKSEEYKGAVTQKVAWINPLGGVVLKDPMSTEQAKVFARSMKGAAVASRGGGSSANKPKPASKPKHTTETPPDDFDENAPF